MSELLTFVSEGGYTEDNPLKLKLVTDFSYGGFAQDNVVVYAYYDDALMIGLYQFASPGPPSVEGIYKADDNGIVQWGMTVSPDVASDLWDAVETAIVAKLQTVIPNWSDYSGSSTVDPASSIIGEQLEYYSE